jgi:glutathione synthase/RimK-type ligase-like ATP-grasp enzyme
LNIYWDKAKKRWTHLRTDKQLHWGKENKPIASISSIESDLSFPVIMREKKIGPLVGILASHHEKKQFAGNIRLFLSLQKQLASKGGILFIFTLRGVKKSYISGYIFNQRTSKWVKSTFPLPDIAYNRLSKRTEEKSPLFKDLTSLLQKNEIPFFNPHFFNKRDVLSNLQTDPFLKKHIPFTISFSSIQHLQYLYNNFTKVYVKPVEGSKGKGIFTLTFSKTSITLQTQKSTKKYFSVPSCWLAVAKLLKSNKYIAQEAIKLNTHLNNLYDLRIHVHRYKDSWDITGIGVRIANSNKITTHVPQGGKIGSVAELNKEIQYETINEIAYKVGDILEGNFGLIGEFSMDVGISELGHYYIFEVNSKPMLFDEPEIEQERTRKLISTCYELSSFN